MKGRELPEDLKNAVCCLKCRKVGVDSVRKKNPGVSKNYDRCQICKSYAYRYGDILTSPIIFVFGTVFVSWVMQASYGDFEYPVRTNLVWTLIMCGVYLNNVSKKKMVRQLLEDHMRKNILDGEQS
jgi:hypothetical protein